MADSVKKVNYCYVTIPAKTGQGAKVLAEVKKAGINMLAFSGFPAAAGKAQLDILVKNLSPVRNVARKNGWKVSQAKKAFHIEGQDRAGAVQQHLQKLADRKINVTAAEAITTAGRYGMILWVKPKDYAKAAKALSAR